MTVIKVHYIASNQLSMPLTPQAQWKVEDQKAFQKALWEFTFQAGAPILNSTLSILWTIHINLCSRSIRDMRLWHSSLQVRRTWISSTYFKLRCYFQICGLIFSQEWKKKRSCSLKSNCILIFQTSTFRGSILRCLTIVCVNAVIISATIDPEDCIATISAQPGLSYQMITIFSWKKEIISRNVQSWDLLLSGSKWERHIVWFDSKNYIYIYIVFFYI